MHFGVNEKVNLNLPKHEKYKVDKPVQDKARRSNKRKK